MDKFIVSARKYRPQTFNTVVGQQHITTTLKNAIKNNQLAHAFLFCGPRGVGKTTCARILAKTINCENLQPDGEACDKCQSCTSFNDGASLNIHELDAASNNSVDDIRSLVEQVRFAPQAGKYKVYIVDEVHMLSSSAFNAFLKTLEEPPPYAIFILATTEKHKILPTILSRCQIFDFKRITTNDTVEHLEEIITKEHLNAEKAALQLIAQKSEGCMRDALSILDKIVSFTNSTVTYQNTLEHLNILDHDYYFKMLDSLLAQDLSSAMLLFDEINRKGFEGDLVLNGFAEFIRNLLVCRDERAAVLLDVVEGMQQRYISTSQNAQTGYLVSALNILNEAEINYKMARNKRLHVELCIIKLNFLQQAISLAADGSNIVKKKRIDGPIAYRNKAFTTNNAPAAAKPIAPQQPEARLYIEQEKPVDPQQHIAQQKPIHTTPPQPVEKPAVAAIKPLNQSGKAKSLFDALKEKVGEKYTIEAVKEVENLEAEKLTQLWLQHAAKLKDESKHSAESIFRLARLQIQSDTHFTVTVQTLTQQKIVEMEKAMVTDILQNAFNNRAITFSFLIEESVTEEVPLYQKLNSRERYERIAAQYPLLKQLKEKLNLEIQY